MSALFDYMVATMRSPRPALAGVDVGELLIAELVREWAARAGVAVDTAPRVAGPRHLRRAIAFIDENLTTIAGVGEIAAAAHVSVRTLSATFVRHLDCTPHEYLRDERMRAAHAVLLADADRSVADVAAAHGYRSATSFTAAYRKAFGETPSQTRSAPPSL